VSEPTPTDIVIHRAGNGWTVEATIVRDLGDGVPWPYKHESVYESADNLLADLAALLMPKEKSSG
jgi:hypothetical protein